mmetsp:Transcript_22677/g.47568  ORF Transcript_22677/g.47568 Transcript_22677/m.47568 type:complete len:276 (-) Transcript_22677:386-1213(-)
MTISDNKHKVLLLLLAVATCARAFQLPASSSRSHSVLRKSSTEDDCFEIDSIDTSRRKLLTKSLTVASSTILSSSFPFLSNAVSNNLTPYDDPEYGFRIQVPSSWEQSVQKLSGRRKALFFVDPNSATNGGSTDTLLFVAYTPVRDDFTSLSSFGSVDQVAQSTILPKGDLAGAEDSSRMLAATSKNNAYYFDYVASPVVPTTPGSSEAKAGQMTMKLPPQHFRTIFTLLPLKNAGASAGLTLVTITMQTTEEKYGDLKGLFDEIVDSYGKSPAS